jgi:hypothetical protein
MTGAQHMAWAKERALHELRPGGGGVRMAFASLAADTDQHPETRNHRAVSLMGVLMRTGQLRTPDEARNFIEQQIQ